MLVALQTKCVILKNGFVTDAIIKKINRKLHDFKTQFDYSLHKLFIINYNNA